ncbi:MAG: tRNA pseudouridine(38-40) synthase TruA [Deltaproteobacteria bacterium]|nr:tRNA pseudouridine(38-40) synthase TruA [Deltaproteobacteria bacterium]
MQETKNIRLALQYDGSRYHGWQRQKGDITIQELLEEKIRILTGEQATVTGAGRTDAGVHALHQVCNFLTRSRLDPQSFHRALNSLLPPDIHIDHAETAPLDFHARFSARSKLYEYRVLNRPERDPFLRAYTWHVPSELDLSEMQKCLPPLLGRRDFSSFMASGSRVTDPVREMTKAEVKRSAEGLLIFLFEADGFLRHMVRNIVGTLVEVGKGRWDSGGFRKILQARDRRLAGIKAPARGLFLKRVRYDLP